MGAITKKSRDFNKCKDTARAIKIVNNLKDIHAADDAVRKIEYVLGLAKQKRSTFERFITNGRGDER